MTVLPFRKMSHDVLVKKNMTFVSHVVDQFDVILFHHLDSIKQNKIVSAKIV